MIFRRKNQIFVKFQIVEKFRILGELFLFLCNCFRISLDFSNALFNHCTVAWVTRPERPQGVKDEVKQARSRPDGPLPDKSRGRVPGQFVRTLVSIFELNQKKMVNINRCVFSEELWRNNILVYSPSPVTPVNYVHNRN